MDWLQVLSLVGANLILFFWNRSESRTDIRGLRAEATAFKTESNQILRELKDEMKDFHGRLLVLEERYLRLREDK